MGQHSLSPSYAIMTIILLICFIPVVHMLVSTILTLPAIDTANRLSEGMKTSKSRLHVKTVLDR